MILLLARLPNIIFSSCSCLFLPGSSLVTVVGYKNVPKTVQLGQQKVVVPSGSMTVYTGQLFRGWQDMQKQGGVQIAPEWLTSKDPVSQ